MAPQSRLYGWDDLVRVPAAPGVYAWYYAVVLRDADVDQAIAQIHALNQGGDRLGAERVVEAFLDRFILRRFTEAPYFATIRGPLKPQYEGELHHQPIPSQSVAVRLAEEPERLRTLQRVLREAVPLFASPIYIGMASDLRSRLGSHKRLIERCRSGQATSRAGADLDFAQRVVEHDLLPSSLRVAVNVIDTDSSTYVDAENVLNRINYPVLGRN